ncbi:MAG: tRNA preQ1(34) S-adenosylmethionine ribosyltransferase-isomerase QueA [Coriobacteriales bacterium]|jgi:S-adenosylmethionine:tRNA ribosyltransferase-isomerase|nr:tRNA preQ1(34) S-adenosylmethionine ribosyltransferase-isomerase QueA [Coriobacteriales bacterium]
MTDITLFDYDLPPELIAQEPLARRDESRLMVIEKASGQLSHRWFYDLPEYLTPNDVLVFNDSRVIPARLFGHRQGGGAAIEVMLAQPLFSSKSNLVDAYDVDTEDWLALVRPSRRLRVGSVIEFEHQLTAELLIKHQDGSVELRLRADGSIIRAIYENGTTPLPPYIRRSAQPSDDHRYQTVYAATPGSVAAPTAGLHFTPELIEACKAKGVTLAWITLHVGIDTFRPVQTDQVEEHKMHSEWFHITEQTAGLLNAARTSGRRIICVGTTSVRALESAVRTPDQSGNRYAARWTYNPDQPDTNENSLRLIKPGWQSTDIYIYPGYSFQATNALITNFHLPKSTLLMLVSAFYQREKVLAAYAEAVHAGYRFFSYGDAMLIV